MLSNLCDSINSVLLCVCSLVTTVRSTTTELPPTSSTSFPTTKVVTTTQVCEFEQGMEEQPLYIAGSQIDVPQEALRPPNDDVTSKVYHDS